MGIELLRGPTGMQGCLLREVVIDMPSQIKQFLPKKWCNIYEIRNTCTRVKGSVRYDLSGHWALVDVVYANLSALGFRTAAYCL